MSNNPILSRLADEVIGFFNQPWVELQILRNYNNYRSMTSTNNSMRDLLATARAIHLAMRHGQLTYDQAKLHVQPILRSVNDHVGRIARQHKVKPRYIKFQDLGRNL